MFWKHFICRYGAPQVVLSDRGANFVSAIMDHLHKLMGTKAITTTPYHPQANGKVERFHRTLNNALAQLVNKSHTNWNAHVDSVLFAYRTSIVEHLQESPFFLVYGRDPRLPTDAYIADNDNPEPIPDLRLHKANYVDTMQRTYKAVHKLMREAKDNVVATYNKGRTPVTFLKGDLVVIRKPPRRKKTAELDNSKKLALRGTGPWRVLDTHGRDTYTVKHCFSDSSEKVNASKNDTLSSLDRKVRP